MAYLLSILLLAAFTLWIPLFIYGIYKIIRKENRKGAYLIVTASLWCILVFSAAVLALVYFSYSTYKNIKGSHKTVEFKPEQHHGEVGEIALTYGKNATINAYDKKNHSSIKSSGTDGRIKFPTGQYSLSNLSITEKDSAGKDWTLSMPLYRTYSSITVEKDKQLEIKTLPPFIASVKSSTQSGKDVFDMELKDGAGNSVTISDSSSNKPPKFQLVDSGGKVVFEKSFEYG